MACPLGSRRSFFVTTRTFMVGKVTWLFSKDFCFELNFLTILYGWFTRKLHPKMTFQLYCNFEGFFTIIIIVQKENPDVANDYF